MSPSQEILDLITKGVSCVIDREHLLKQLTSGKKLRIKFGIDPTGTSVHIGHAVPILKLRAFQQLGHQIVLIIGDSTAQVGDTSDKNAERPMLAREETRRNAESYLAQFGRLLDLSKLEIHYNSEWMDTTNFNMVGELAKNFSVAEMLDRDNFSKRYKGGVRISLQEFLYPIMQGWDSVKIRADVEIGGNDQYFNILAGRTLQEAYGQEKQDIMTFDLLEGTDGRKMSKSYKNFIGVSERAEDMFVKVMEIKDDLILRYYTLATLFSLAEIAQVEKRLKDGVHPREIKLELATTIVTLFHSAQDAERARAYFEKVLSEGNIPDASQIETIHLPLAEYKLPQLLKELHLVSSSGEARDAVTGGGTRVNNIVVTDIQHVCVLDISKPVLIQVGKKKFRNVLLVQS
jgi:tyrosyl-tRNA synthetase